MQFNIYYKSCISPEIFIDQTFFAAPDFASASLAAIKNVIKLEKSIVYY